MNVQLDVVSVDFILDINRREMRYHNAIFECFDCELFANTNLDLEHVNLSVALCGHKRRNMVPKMLSFEDSRQSFVVENERILFHISVHMHVLSSFLDME